MLSLILVNHSMPRNSYESLQLPANGNFHQLQVRINFAVTNHYLINNFAVTMYCTVVHQYSPTIRLISYSSLCSRGISWCSSLCWRGISWFKYRFWASWRCCRAWYRCPSRWSHWYGVINGSYHLTKGTEKTEVEDLVYCGCEHTSTST